MIDITVKIAEYGFVPDTLVRLGIRYHLWRRVRQASHNFYQAQGSLTEIIDHLKTGPIAHPMTAEQSREVPADLFQAILGRHMKYSSGLWDEARNLDEAEEAMLQLYAERAQLVDGQKILVLGSGWGSLSIWLAKQFPNSKILSLCNSNSQRNYVMQRAQDADLKNLRTVIVDINEFDTSAVFDRVLAIEMLEYLHNYQILFRRIAKWLEPQGLFFTHIFCHNRYAYLFEDRQRVGWMARYFFGSGLMPSQDLLLYFQDDLQVADRWLLSGRHYAKTAEAWHRRLCRRRLEIMPILAECYGKDESILWFHRWKFYFLHIAELFAAKKGEAWTMAHFLFKKRSLVSVHGVDKH